MAGWRIGVSATRLQVFREVIERGSFSSAAEALSFTQPAVSGQIAALEREAGAQLVERLPHAEAIPSPSAPSNGSASRGSWRPASA